MDQTISLRTRVDEITSLPLSEAIPALLDITSRLTVILSPEGQRLITHPDYADTAKLNHLASFYLKCGERCTDEHAPFRLRLDYLDLDPRFFAYYEQTDNAIDEALNTGAISQPYHEYEGGGCAHCAGEPAAVIAGVMQTQSRCFSRKKNIGRIGEMLIGLRIHISVNIEKRL